MLRARRAVGGGLALAVARSVGAVLVDQRAGVERLHGLFEEVRRLADLPQELRPRLIERPAGGRHVRRGAPGGGLAAGQEDGRGVGIALPHRGVVAARPFARLLGGVAIAAMAAGARGPVEGDEGVPREDVEVLLDRRQRAGVAEGDVLRHVGAQLDGRARGAGRRSRGGSRCRGRRGLCGRPGRSSRRRGGGRGRPRAARLGKRRAARGPRPQFRRGPRPAERAEDRTKDA